MTNCDAERLLELRARLTLIRAYLDILSRACAHGATLPSPVLDDYLERAQLQLGSLARLAADMTAPLAAARAVQHDALGRRMSPQEIPGGPHD